MSRINTSTLVSGQLPEFVREDYSTFVSFIEAYYEFLDNNSISDYKSLKDIDSISDTFIQYLRDELSTISEKFLGNERFLLSHVRDLYRAKGSEASFNLLFKMLYNKDIEVKYPRTQMLRVSDGKWVQNYSVFVSDVNGDIFSLIGNIAQVKTSLIAISLQITDVVLTPYHHNNLPIYEIFVNKGFYGDIQVGSILSFETVSSIILPTTSKSKIINGGKNFKPGELYSIQSGSGSGTVLKITKVDSVGAIQSAQILKFGQNYTTDFVIQIQSNYDKALSLSSNSISLSSNSVGVNENYSGIIETGIINTFDYVDSTFITDVTYVIGDALATFSSTTTTDIVDSNNIATIQFYMGALAKYPGYYSSNDGFLDDNMFIQDSRYYQLFSYDVIVNEKLDSYKSILKTFIHPAGMALFGTYTINNEFDVSITNIVDNRVSNSITINATQ